MAASAMQLEQMSTFAVGEALIFYEKLMRPFTMRIKEWWGEIENQAEKEAMVSSKNDADLRYALADRDTYQDENLKSIKIIGSKYFHLLSDIESRIAPCEYWLNSVAAQAEKINKLYSYLERVELGKVQLNDEDKQVRYDQLEALQSSRESLLADKSKIHEALDIINTVGNWVFALERLKNGRCTRFGAPESELIKITLLQTQMCDRSLQLYKCLIQAVGTTKDIKKIDKEKKYVDSIESAKEGLLATLTLTAEANKASVTDEDAKQAYEANKANFEKKEDTVKLQLVVVPSADKAKAEAALKEATANPANFSAVVQKYSANAAKTGNGETPEITASQLSQGYGPISQAIASVQPGQVVNSVVTVGNELYVIKVLEKNPKGLIPFEKVKDSIKNQIRTQKRQIETQKYLQTVTDKYGLSKIDDAIKNIK